MIDRTTTLAELRYRKILELAAQVDRPQIWKRLFREIDERDFFAGQVSHFARREREERQRDGESHPARSPVDTRFGIFDQAAADLERHLLPATVRLRDWERFLHYLLVAANLRGLAEALAEPEILGALVRSGRLGFAREVASRLPTPETRARARCAVTAALPPGKADPRAGTLALELRQDLDEVGFPRSDGEAQAWCSLVEEAARTAPLDHRGRWPEWIGRLAAWPVLADRAWLALAEGFLRVGSSDSELGEVLAALQQPTAGLEAVASALARTPVEDLWSPLTQIAAHLGGDVASWRALVVILRQRMAEPGDLAALWRDALARFGPPPWAAALVDAGGELWRRLPAALISETVAAVDDAAAAAALLIASWNPAEEPERATEVRRAVERIPPGEERLRRHLDLLWASRCGPHRELRSQLTGISRFLDRERYAAGEGVLVRWLDLMAELMPGRHLRREVENLLWSPAGTPAVLRALAERSASPALQEEILARAEPYAATVAVTEAEGFELRREVMVRLVCRRCRAEGSLERLADCRERLLPEEEDDLRAALAGELTDAERPDLAEQAAAGIGDRRLRLLAQLRTYRRRPVSEELVAPLALYEAATAIAPIEAELAALAALQEVPADPETVATAHLADLHRRGRKVEALVDLAWHALADQRRRFPPGRQDRKAALLPLRQALGVVESQQWLLALAPELVELGSQLGRAECLAELQEGIEQVVQLDAAPWPVRARALEAILAALPRLIAADWPGVAAGHPARARTVARFLRWLGHLPDSLPAGAGRDELRRHWHQLLPLLAASSDRLPAPTRRYLLHPLRAWICYEGLGGLAVLVGRERVWRLLQHVERLVPARLRRDPAGPWEALAGEPARVPWSWLEPGQQEAVRLGLAGRAEILQRAADPGSDGDGSDLLAPVAYRLAAIEPAACADLLEQLPPGAARDDLCFRLVRHRWLEPTAARRAAGLIADLPTRLRAGAWLVDGAMAAAALEAWAPALAAAVGEAVLSPADPAVRPLRHALWQTEPAIATPLLARAGIRSLETGGKAGAESAACWFLAACLAPTLGQAAPAGWNQRLEGLRAAVAEAVSLRSGPSARQASASEGRWSRRDR